MKKVLTAFPFIFLGIIANHGTAQSIFSPEEADFAGNWLASISDSSPAEDLILAAMVAEAHGDTGSSTRFYASALATDPGHINVLHGVAARCQESELIDQCEELAVLEQFQNREPDNALPLLYAALFYASVGNDSQALTELKDATNSDRFNDRIIQRTFSIREKLIQIGYPGDRISYIANVYSIDNLNFHLYAGLVNLCNEMGETNQEWNDACKDIGRLLEDYSTSYIALRVGQVILSNMLGFNEDDLSEQQSVDRRRAYTHRWRELASERLAFMKARTSAADIFYEDWLTRDEMYAMNRAMGRLDGKRLR